MITTSVIICSHNPRDDFLSRVLDKLRAQTLPTAQWELVLVDNASDDVLERKWDVSWHPHGYHIREDKLGLSWARRHGIRESHGEVLIFVDDDNLLEPEYLERGSQLAGRWPILGAWGAGAILPDFEAEPPQHLRNLMPSLAIRNMSNARWTNVLPCIDATPFGAGLCVRRNVAEAYCSLENDGVAITGRRGALLLSGDDIEISFVSCSVGLGVGTFPQLRLTHLIRKERVDERYLTRIKEGTDISNALLAYKWLGVVPRSPFSLRSMLTLVMHFATTRGVHRQLHLAGWRAEFTARRIIGATLTEQLRRGHMPGTDSRRRLAA
jgi:glycosyltransferase involved in cell wall biosynthesis